MILVISKENDQSTDLVVNWLKYFKQKVVRLNAGDALKIHSIRFEPKISIKFSVKDGVILDSNEIKGYWYRRGEKSSFLEPYNISLKNINLKKHIISYIREGQLVNVDFLFYVLRKSTLSVGNIDNSENNKLIHLAIAKSLGIKIPSTYVLSDLNEVSRACSQQDIVSKSTSNGFFYNEVNHLKTKIETYGLYVNKVKKASLRLAPEKFYPSLFQQNIIKKLDVRTFYLKGNFYSMAIFSQSNMRTKIDFRRYDESTPNYSIPFKLPKVLCKKLKTFMVEANLDSGSIDLIYGADNKFYFLEVNPIGQFDMVSMPCNYYLEKEIALSLFK